MLTRTPTLDIGGFLVRGCAILLLILIHCSTQHCALLCTLQGCGNNCVDIISILVGRIMDYGAPKGDFDCRCFFSDFKAKKKSARGSGQRWLQRVRAPPPHACLDACELSPLAVSRAIGPGRCAGLSDEAQRGVNTAFGVSQQGGSFLPGCQASCRPCACAAFWSPAVPTGRNQPIPPPGARPEVSTAARHTPQPQTHLSRRRFVRRASFSA